MRIWCQSSLPLTFLPDYKAAQLEHFNALKEPENEITCHGVEIKERAELDGTFGRWFGWLNDRELFKQYIQAEREGYDAIMVVCSGDPAITEAREVLSIPIVGSKEVTQFVAPMLGKVGGLSHTDILGPNKAFILEFHKALTDPERIRSSFFKAAEKAISNGVEVILPGCGVLNEVAYKHGWKMVGDAVVFDQSGTMLKFTETILQLGIKPAKKHGFPGRPALEQVEEVLEVYGLK